MKLFLKIIPIAALICIILAGVIYIFISYYAVNSKPQKSDTMIVLGCQTWGKSPSWSLEYRLKKAVELYKSGYARQIIVSGGQGSDEEAAESSIMKNWLISHGIDGSKIIEESKSTSTYENIKFSKVIMDENHLKTAIIVSNDFHIFRSLSLAKKLGVQASGCPAPSVAHTKIFDYCRETLSVVKSFLFDR